jgi:viroplasmin and RNaseH domain-containing protein
MFRGQKPDVYDSWGDCSEYVVGYNGVAYRNYVTWWEAEVAYATFFEQHNKNCKPEQVAKFWNWKILVILVQFVVIVVLCYK